MELGYQSLFHGYGLKFPFDMIYDADALDIGAYAFFGPEEFDSVYADLCQPAANGQLFIAGEATSACHAYASFFYLRVHLLK